MSESRKAWQVVFSGLGINLVLGFLYAWGILSSHLIDEHGWTTTQTQIPYMVASILFALSMILGGRIQDKRGPRFPLWLATLLASSGFFLSSRFLTLWGLTLFLMPARLAACPRQSGSRTAGI